MTLAIEKLNYGVIGVSQSKEAINKQFAENSLKIALNVLTNGRWLQPTPWYVGTFQKHWDALKSHENGYQNAVQYRASIVEYKKASQGLQVDVDNTQEEMLVDYVEELHAQVAIALAVDVIFKGVVGVLSLVFIVTLLPINAIPLSASAIAGKAFGVTAIAYAVRCAWQIAYPPGQKVAKNIQTILTTSPFWKKVLAPSAPDVD